jgi:hypothetical protein
VASNKPKSKTIVKLIPAPLLRRLMLFIFPKRHLTVSLLNGKVLMCYRFVHVFGHFFVYDGVVIATPITVVTMPDLETTEPRGNA